MNLKYRYGFIYRFIFFILEKLNYLNLVEGFKYIVGTLNKDKSNKDLQDTYERIGIDIFIVLKWLYILLLLYFNQKCNIATISVWYLIIFNIYSYFYNHAWSNEALEMKGFTFDRIRSRFLNLCLAILYSTFCFSYLYTVVYESNFCWSNAGANFLYALQYSFSNSLAANYDKVKPITDWGDNLSNIQLLITFIFVTIVLNKSMPSLDNQNSSASAL